MEKILMKKNIAVLTLMLISSTTMVNRAVASAISGRDQFDRIQKENRQDYQRMSLRELVERANKNDRTAQEQLIDNFFYRGLYTNDSIVSIVRSGIILSEWTNLEERALKNFDYSLLFIIFKNLSSKLQEAIEAAAAQGHAPAQNALGFMYQSGYDVKKGQIQAVKWYQKAADQGYVPAQNSLGDMYMNGLGVDMDIAQAVEWYRKAADHGHAVAQNTLGFIYQNGFGLEKDEVQAVEWYRKAADHGYALAQNTLVEMYRNGLGVQKDIAKAVEFLMKSNKYPVSIALQRLLPVSSGEPGLSSENFDLETYRKESDDFKIAHARASQTWSELAERNNPNSGFQSTTFAIPSLYPKYKKLEELYLDFDLMVAEFLRPGFMVTCFSPNYQILTALRQEKSEEIPFVRAYTYRGKNFFSFGQENVKKADQLMRILLEDHQLSARELEGFHVSMRKKILKEVGFLQINSEDLDQKTEDERQEINKKASKLNKGLEKQEEILGYFKGLRSIPEKMGDLLIRGAGIRNQGFLGENPLSS